jgi:hypothetical protein
MDNYSGQPRWPDDASLRISVEPLALWIAMQISLN